MVKGLLLTLLLLVGLSDARAQYPFEKFTAVKFRKAGPWEVYSRVKKEGKVHWVIKVPHFYGDSSSLTVQVTSFVKPGKSDMFVFPTQDTSIIRIFKGTKQIQAMIEPTSLGVSFGYLVDTLSYGDINNDSLPDIKIKSWLGGNGLAGYYCRIIYLFQRADGKFDRASLTNMELVSDPERDLDGDGNYEIVTTHHEYHKNHSYWVFNVYRFAEGKWLCVNDEFDYPILVQMLYRSNYKVTDKVSREDMKKFSRELPMDFSASRLKP